MSNHEKQTIVVFVLWGLLIVACFATLALCPNTMAGALVVSALLGYTFGLPYLLYSLPVCTRRGKSGNPEKG